MIATERFFSKVNRSGECWIWLGSKSNGYGQFWNGTRKIPAHWFLLDNDQLELLMNDGVEACHYCDNRLCVRPSHIFVGTHGDNMRDMVAKGRHNTVPGCYAMLAVRNSRGIRNPQSKLTEEQVNEIKSTPRTWGSGRVLASKFRVTEFCISKIRVGKNWQ